MSFVGPVNRRGSMFVRPHDVEILHGPAPDAEEAMIERIVHLGFEARVELVLGDGDSSGRRSPAPRRRCWSWPRARSSTPGRGGPGLRGERRAPRTEELPAA